jgi:hypothetical protein
LHADLKLLALISGSARLGRLCRHETIVDSDAAKPERLLSTTPFSSILHHDGLFSVFSTSTVSARSTRRRTVA